MTPEALFAIEREEEEMGKKIGRILAIVACAFALCLVVTACGSSKKYAEEFVGHYQIVSMDYDGESISEDDMESLREWGLDVVMVLDEDGTGEINLMGEVSDVTWEATGEGEGTIVLDGEYGGNISLADGQLTITEDGSEGELVFAPISEDDYNAALEAMAG